MVLRAAAMASPQSTQFKLKRERRCRRFGCPDREAAGRHPLETTKSSFRGNSLSPPAGLKSTHDRPCRRVRVSVHLRTAVDFRGLRNDGQGQCEAAERGSVRSAGLVLVYDPPASSRVQTSLPIRATFPKFPKSKNTLGRAPSAWLFAPGASASLENDGCTLSHKRPFPEHGGRS